MDNKGYVIKIDQFEGPLDLLLYLIQKEEMDICDISVSGITNQYLEYLEVMKDLNINVASSYLSMAATLTRLKAREINGSEDETDPEDEEDEFNIQSKEKLIQQLIEYRKFKEAADTLKFFEAENIGSYPRGKNESPDKNLAVEEEEEKEVGLFDLITAFKNLLERIDSQEPPKYEMKKIDFKIDDKIDTILTKIEDTDEVEFTSLFGEQLIKMEVVVTFIALLELVKMQKVRFRQEGNFEKLYIIKRKPAGTADDKQQT